jgi:PilZ domain
MNQTDNAYMSVKSKTEASSVDTTDRRQHPRIDVVVPVDGRVVPEDDQVVLLNVSEGGFLIQAPSELPCDAVWAFRFTVAGSDPIELLGRVVQTKRAPTSDAMYLVGVEFFADRSGSHQLLLERLTRARKA